MKKLTYIISDIDKALAFEWVALGLKPKFKLTFILIGKAESQMANFLSQHGIEFYELTDSTYPSMLRKWIALFGLLRKEKPDIVHTHLWRANLLGLTTSWVLNIKQRIYTRHHATLHYTEYPSGRKWDRLCNALATDIIAISNSIKKILTEWDKANASKITVIPHGFDLNYFEHVGQDRINRLSNRYKITGSDYPVIGVISRYMEWKGIQYILPAFKKLRAFYPNAKLILANAKGEFEQVIKEHLRELPEEAYVEIKFESDLAALYHTFNIFVHVPVDPYVEAYGQTYVESLVAGVPAVFTLSGIASEFIRHKENAWVVDFRNSDQIEDAIKNILGNKELREKLIENGRKSIQQFSLNIYISKLENLYQS